MLLLGESTESGGENGESAAGGRDEEEGDEEEGDEEEGDEEEGDEEEGDEALYRMEFDGASKGNPGRAGAGSVLWDECGNEGNPGRAGAGSVLWDERGNEVRVLAWGGEAGYRVRREGGGDARTAMRGVDGGTLLPPSPLFPPPSSPPLLPPLLSHFFSPSLLLMNPLLPFHSPPVGVHEGGRGAGHMQHGRIPRVHRGRGAGTGSRDHQIACAGRFDAGGYAGESAGWVKGASVASGAGGGVVRPCKQLALALGITRLHVQGDSMLVVMQVGGMVGFIGGVELALALGITRLHVQGDSMLVVMQCNMAEYRAFIGGVELALALGITRLHVQGDSMLVVMQVQKKWKVNAEMLRDECKHAQELVSRVTYPSSSLLTSHHPLPPLVTPFCLSSPPCPAPPCLPAPPSSPLIIPHHPAPPLITAHHLTGVQPAGGSSLQ
ncbi:unnamed protein product [Closterium sp. Naga37s-1]|nr:unnamed protein product [Closterium sp. Naga37s-1]